MSDWKIEKPAFPNNTDQLFTSEEDWWNNACLNYLPNGWVIYSIGYKEAADTLVKQVTDSGVGHDALVYPILFLYRQYLELTLKDLIRQGRKLLYKHELFPKTHRIDQLWSICNELLTEITPGESKGKLKEIGRLISEFSDVDPNSMAFRYPEDKNGTPSLPGISHINLRNVGDIINKISIILEGADAQIDEYLSFKDEMQP